MCRLLDIQNKQITWARMDGLGPQTRKTMKSEDPNGWVFTCVDSTFQVLCYSDATQTMHGTGIFTLGWLNRGQPIGIPTSLMESLGYKFSLRRLRSRVPRGSRSHTPAHRWSTAGAPVEGPNHLRLKTFQNRPH